MLQLPTFLGRILSISSMTEGEEHHEKSWKDPLKRKGRESYPAKEGGFLNRTIQITTTICMRPTVERQDFIIEFFKWARASLVNNQPLLDNLMWKAETSLTRSYKSAHEKDATFLSTKDKVRYFMNRSSSMSTINAELRCSTSTGHWVQRDIEEKRTIYGEIELF